MAWLKNLLHLSDKYTAFKYDQIHYKYSLWLFSQLILIKCTITIKLIHTSDKIIYFSNCKPKLGENIGRLSYQLFHKRES